MIDIKDLEAFLAIIDGGSLSKAAEDLKLTQPALSLKLKKIETELNVKLFQRTPRHMVPLDAARTIEPKVRDLLAKFDGVKEALASTIKEVRGQVRIGCLMGWFDTLLVPAFGRLYTEAPLIRVRLHVDQTENLLHMLSHGQLDMAIVAQPFEKVEGLSAEHLLDEELVLVGRDLPKHASETERKKALLARPWVTLTVPDPLVDKYWREQFSGQPFPWDKVTVPVSLDHIQALPKILRSIPDAVAVLPKQTVVHLVTEGIMEVAQAVPHRNGLFLMWRTDGLELHRFQFVRKVLMAQVGAYLANE